MTLAVPTSTPPTLVAGSTWVWDRDYGDFPAPTWTAIAYFENAAAQFSVASAANGTAQRFTIAATTTADYKAGRYRVRVQVTDGSSVYTADDAWVDVESNPNGTTSTADQRSWARRTLEAIEAFLEGNATTAQQSMSVAGRSISRWSLSELMQFRDQLRGEIRTAEQGSNSGLGRNIKVRYGRS